MKGSMWRWKWDVAARVGVSGLQSQREDGRARCQPLCPCGEKAEPPQRNWMRLIEESKGAVAGSRGLDAWRNPDQAGLDARPLASGAD